MYTLISTKGVRHCNCTLAEAIEYAKRMDADFQPAFGVTVEKDGRTVWDTRWTEGDSDGR